MEKNFRIIRLIRYQSIEFVTSKGKKRACFGTPDRNKPGTITPL